MQLVLQLTRDCNFACTYCYQAHRKGRGMPPGIAEQAVQFLIDQGHAHVAVTWFGGEPLLERSLIEAVQPRLQRDRDGAGRPGHGQDLHQRRTAGPAATVPAAAAGTAARGQVRRDRRPYAAGGGTRPGGVPRRSGQGCGGAQGGQGAIGRGVGEGRAAAADRGPGRFDATQPFTITLQLQKGSWWLGPHVVVSAKGP